MKLASLLLFLTTLAGCQNPPSATSILQFTMKNIDGQDQPLQIYQGKVILIVNVASKCGLTPQYEALEKLFQTYQKQGLVILGFPANNFKNQEPGDEAEIKQFCTATYGVTFPLFAKISVLGAEMHPLYRFLTSEKTNPGFSGDIQWNFTKFLIDRQGKVIARFEPRVKPDSPEMQAAIENALKR